MARLLNWGRRVGGAYLYAPNGSMFAVIMHTYNPATNSWNASVSMRAAGVKEALDFPSVEDAEAYAEASYLLAFGGD